MDFGREPEPTGGETAREERIKRLILAAVPHCGMCRRQYTVTNFAVIGHREHLWMVSVQCEGCQHQGFITAVVEGHGIEGRHIPRESRAEFFSTGAEIVPQSQPVTVDDLLNIHDFLDDFNGDFASLFERRKGSATEGQS